MIFDKFLKKHKKTEQKSSTHTSGNREKTVANENDVIVLWWIAKKKKGYDKTTNGFPKWFLDRYGIDFNKVMSRFISKGFLSNDGNIVKITTTGEEKLKELDYVIYIHEHPQYRLTISDFKNANNIHNVRNEDITWGVLNSRIIEYTKNSMWTSLASNYANMADLLITEKKYDEALDFIFAVAFIETSGMTDNNELTPIWTEFMSKKIRYLSNGMPEIFLLEINNYYVTVPFMKVQENLNLEWAVIKDRFLSSRQIKSLEKILPFRYFEKEQSFEIMRQAVEAGGKKGIFTLSDCRKKLKWNKPDEHSRKYFYASVENKMNRDHS